MIRHAMLAALLLVTSASANAGFTRVPLKYTSLAHLSVDASSMTARQPYGEVASGVADYLRRAGATITSFRPTKFAMIQTEADRRCERWVNSIWQQEFAALRANKYSQFNKIDRRETAPCKAGHWLTYGYTPQAVMSFSDNAVYITAVADRSIDRTINYVSPTFSTLFGVRGTAGVWSMVPRAATSRINLETVYNIWVWRDDAGATRVFAIALPRSDNVEASPEASIGYDYHRLTDGSIEAAGIKALLAWVSQATFESTTPAAH